MAKTLDARLNDTLAYMKTKLTSLQYDEVTRLLGSRNLGTLALSNNDDISKEMSLGHKNPFKKESRRAKRSLILLAMLFITDPIRMQAEIARIKLLPDSNETALVAKMQSWFTRAGVTGQEIADHAQRIKESMPNWANQNYFAWNAVRGSIDKTVGFNCYNACVFWAFQAGAISLRYMYNKLADFDGNKFYDTFFAGGSETVIEYRTIKGTNENGLEEKDPSKWRSEVISDRSRGGEVTVPAGVTIYFDQEPNKKFGHIACSLGDGTVISQNHVAPAIWGVIGGPSKWTTHPKRRPQWDAEVQKMVEGKPHILPIRYMLDLHFYPENGYKKLRTTVGQFWDAIPAAER